MQEFFLIKKTKGDARVPNPLWTQSTSKYPRLIWGFQVLSTMMRWSYNEDENDDNEDDSDEDEEDEEYDEDDYEDDDDASQVWSAHLAFNGTVCFWLSSRS